MNDWNASVEDSFPAHDDEENSIAFSVVIEDENGDERTLGIAQLIDEHRRRAKAEQTIVRNSSRDPINQLMSVAYERLQKIASHRLGYGPRQGIEESGDLLHEAWSNRINRLIADEVQVRDSSHFFALAARLIRQTLIDLHRKSTRVVRDDDGNKQRVRKHHNESSMRSDDPQRESSPMAMQADERAPSVQDRRAIISMEAAMEQLPPELEQILDMMVINGMSRRMAAETLRITEAEARSRLMRARIAVGRIINADT